MDYRALLDHPALAGIALRGCAARDEWEGGEPEIACLAEVAHAHLSGKYDRWVCVRHQRHLNATTLRHEIAHLLTGHRVHNERWRRVVRSLGGRVEERYRRK